MITKTKKTAPVIEDEVELEDELEDEEDDENETPKSSEEYVAFKLSHFYAILVVLAFAIGVVIGYVARRQDAVVVAQQPVAPVAGAPQPTPKPIVYKIETKGFPSFGPENAPIVIVEFSDYQCPYCYKWRQENYDNLLAAYPGKIRFVYRNFPLSFHQNAFPAAEAALCAGDQGAYWQFHKVLFENQAALNNQAGDVLDQPSYNKFATVLKLDVAVFEKCMTSRKYKQFVLDDMTYAASLPNDSNGDAAVGGTPTFFINGRRLGGAYPLGYFKQIIDAELANK